MSEITEVKKWYQGTGFYVAAIMATFGFFSGLQEQDVSGAVQLSFGLSGAVLAIRQKIKDSGIDFKRWILNPNTMAYLGTAITSLVPMIPAEIFGELNQVIVAAVNKNYSALLAGVFSVASIVYFTFFGKKAAAK
jgi:hypothetical protein